MRRACLALCAVLAAGSVEAKGNALIITNSRYDRLQAFFGAPRVSSATEALQEQGVEVTQAVDANPLDMQRALNQFINRLDEDGGPVVVVLSGAFVHGAAGSYLLPFGQVADLNTAGVLMRSFPVDAALTVLARYPGRALLLLAETGIAEGTGDFLAPGALSLDVPQGVTVLRGPAPDMARFATQVLPQPGARLVAQARNFELDILGYAPDTHVWLRRGDVSPSLLPTSDDPGLSPLVVPDDSRRDAEAWAAAQREDSAAGYRAYLQLFPDGDNAPAARQRLAAIEAEPFYTERRAEEALRLTRPQRRDVQRDLSILGYNTRGIDGIFGPGTRGAIRQWQESVGLTASGYLNQRQITRLDRQAERRAIQLEEEARARQEELERRDRAYWQQTGASGTEEGLRAYLDRYPDGAFSAQAQQALEQIVAEREARAAAQDRRAWRRAREADTIAAYRRYIDNRPNGAFVNDARARIAELRRAAEESDVVARARRQEEALQLNAAARRLAEARLEALGLNPGQVDGNFTNRTRRAIRQYQRARNLTVSGYLDQATVIRLLADGILGR